MRRDVLVIREAQIRAALDMPSCIDAVSAALASYSGGAAELPAVIHLEVPDHEGEIHIKAGYIHGEPIYACKFASGFPEGNDGMVVVFDATTGAPSAFLFDNGCITDIRTGAAGGVAVRHLAPEVVERVAIIGTGEQAAQQLTALLRERPGVTDVALWGRSGETTAARAESLSTTAKVPVKACDTVEESVEGASVIITVTPSREPLVQRSWVAAGATVIAVGSDGPGKQELDPALLTDADLVVVDARPQCLERGELQHVPALAEVETTELGEVASGAHPGRTTEEQLIVCDLTGVGVQDVAAAALVLERAGESAPRLAI